MLPKRVPWQSWEEFEQVYAWLFASEGNVNLQERALARISVWVARGSCPPAIESTADLIDATLQATLGQASAHALRLTHSMALIRFVNGLVDPVQQGYYARPIASIAQQLGLPLRFVELRHAATHEHLPPLRVLREATRSALDWLYQCYWLPRMQTTATSSLVNDSFRQDMALLLRKYRDQQLLALKDVSKFDRKDHERTVSAIEKLAGGSSEQTGSSEGSDVLAELLVGEEGFLHDGNGVPPIDPQSFALPQNSLLIWRPLLLKMFDSNEGFEQSLVRRLTDAMSAVENDTEEILLLEDGTPSASARAPIWAAWVVHLVTQSTASSMSYNIAVRSCLLEPNSVSIALLRLLSSHSGGLDALIPLAQARTSSMNFGPHSNIDLALSTMESRLSQMSSALASDCSQGKPATHALANAQSQAAWQLIDEAKWRPCPIGCLPDGRMPDLSWPIAVAD